MKKDNIKLMEICGTHTMAIARSGIKKLLPKTIELLSGPGCPVCVTAQYDIDKAIAIAGLPNVIMATFGDMMRVPGTRSSFADLKQRGADIRVVYSPLDALNVAQENPLKKIVFMGIGFETTSPAVAATVAEAKKRKINNFYILSYFKLLFPALDALAQDKKLNVDGFICPGHVSVITGTAPYQAFVKKYKKPCVITGFENNDIIKGIKRLVEMVLHHTTSVEIEYSRAVKKQGNKKARLMLHAIFSSSSAEWRGFGIIKKSGLSLKKKYEQFDAEKYFNIQVARKPEPQGCICGMVLKGIRSPSNCRLFKKICTPAQPVGPCMVSSEGTCAAYFKYN